MTWVELSPDFNHKLCLQEPMGTEQTYGYLSSTLTLNNIKS